MKTQGHEDLDQQMIMSRFPSTNKLGKPFDAATIRSVWDKAELSSKHRPFRTDTFGSLMWKEGYENINSKFGWEIDHIRPVSEDGGDELENLQALQWENNRHKRNKVISLNSQVAA